MQSIEVVKFAGTHPFAGIMPQSYGADSVERAEADQAIAAANVEDDVARPECGAVEDAIASPLQLLNKVGREVRPTLATLPNPERPAVFRHRGRGVYR